MKTTTSSPASLLKPGFFAAGLLLCFLVAVGSQSRAADGDVEFFEKRIRPLLANRCWKCHSAKRQEGGLRLDTAAGIRKGGESGPAVRARDLKRSLLITAVQQTTDLKMPPNGKLAARDVEALEQWVKAGAFWPEGDIAEPKREEAKPSDSVVNLIAPDDGKLSSSLQLWFRADALALKDGSAVHVWPDGSGRGHDLSATSGVRENGTGTPPTFVKQGRVNGRAAVRFETGNGMASSPDHRVDINGDAAATIFLVGQWQVETNGPPYHNVLMIGNPAAPSNPDRPLAFYLELDQRGESLDFAGGHNHDAILGRGSNRLLYDEPRIITVTKSPGPMRKGTRFYFEGRPSRSVLGRELSGTNTVPDVQHRTDIGVSIGKGTGWSGNIRGDYSEVIVYNRVLTDEERSGVETYLTSKYGFLSPARIAEARRQFTKDEKAHWSFQPVRDPQPPAVSREDWPQATVDRFILARLDAAGLQPAPPADRVTLIRRVTYDLTGLPPAPAEVVAFVRDPSPDESAFAKVADRLLASPHYGERWGRNWLDVARYADTTANDGNFVMRYAYRYRDWVIDSFNRDRPYDEFLRHQLAGDLLPDPDRQETAERVIATGFLMVGPKALAETDKEQVRMDVVDEQIDVTGRAMLGLTISCARCHDHKFDPIPTVDYYSIAGIFRSTEMFSDEVRNAAKWMEYDVPLAGDTRIPVMAPKEGTPTHLRVHVRGNRFRLGQLAPRRFLQVLAGEGHDILRGSSSGRLELADWITSKDNPLTARVMVNRIWQGHFGRGLVASSGNFGTQGDRPSHPELLDWLATQFIESGWSVKAMHRLILSSAVWQQSSLPNSATAHRAMQVDAENRLLWRSPRRRLDAEEVRDSLLTFGNRLDDRLGDGALAMRLYKEGEILDANRGVSSASKVNSNWAGFETPRRSVYLPVVRNGQPDVLALFDVADANSVTPVRNETTVSSQAAFLLNSSFARQQGEGLARVLIGEHADDDERLQAAFRRVLGRPPSDLDRSEFLAFVSSARRSMISRGATSDDATLTAWTQICQTIFCLNSFLYVD